MSVYKHPYRDMEFVLQHLVDFDELCASADLQEINMELASVILTEAGKLATDVLAPLNKTGDLEGVTLTDKGVKEAPGFADAFNLFREGGWASLTGPEAFGGQELPNVLGAAASEVWQSSNLAFSLCYLLSSGAIEALHNHGSDELKAAYLPKMVSGEWAATMNLTEPAAGSDLSAISTKAVAQGDHYLIRGQKIFISWGDHQMTDNIVHLVLARLPDAPAGVKGISLFVVPKFLPDASGNPGQANDLRCVSLEHKLGIHGSPTCVMSYGDGEGAIGYLVGEEHKGLHYMFTMMNNARQAVGLQGVAISERAYQQAREFAKERIQGTNKDGSRFAIIKFPDVRRMLMQMKASIEAMRALAFIAAADIDRCTYAKDSSSKMKYQARVDLLTPIVKGWSTELAQEVTYLATQIHGGMGFVEETGIAQHARDGRILTIYEGTTGIQAMDFVGRKILHNNGAYLSDLLEDIDATAAQLKTETRFGDIADSLIEAVALGNEAKQWLLDNAPAKPDTAGGVSVQFLMTFGYICGAWVMARTMIKAQGMLDSGEAEAEFLESKLLTAKFYFEQILPRAKSGFEAVKAGAETFMALNEEQF